MYRLMIVFLLVIGSIFSNAQAPPLWKTQIEAWVSWMRPLSNSNLIVECDKTMYCISPDDGSVIWSNGNIVGYNLEDFKPIAFTPVFQMGALDPILVNATDGKIVFKAADHNISSLYYKEFLSDRQAMLLLGRSKENMKMLLIDYNSGDVLWSMVLGERKRMSTNLTQSYLAGTNVQDYDYDTKFTASGNLLFTYNDKLFHIDMKTGEILWKYEPELSAKMIFITPDDENAILVSGAVPPKMTGNYTIESIHIASGKPAWEPQTYKGVFDMLMFNGDMAVIQGGRVFQQLNYKTGEPLHKTYAAYGLDVSDYRVTDKGYLFAKGFGDSYTLYYIDFNGTPLWKKGLRISGLLHMQVRENNIVVLTATKFHVIDKATGKPIKGASEYFGKVSTWSYDAENDDYYVFATSDNNLIKVNASTYEVVPIAGPIQFKYEQAPKYLEFYEDGYGLYSDRNICFVNLDGSVQFLKSYFNGLSVEKDLDALTANLPFEMPGDAANDKNYNTTNSIDPSIYEAFLDKMEQPVNVAILDYKGELEDRHPVVTARSQKTGKVIQEIHLQKHPIYTVDPLNLMLYYKSGPYEISAYAL